MRIGLVRVIGLGILSATLLCADAIPIPFPNLTNNLPNGVLQIVINSSHGLQSGSLSPAPGNLGGSYTIGNVIGGYNASGQTVTGAFLELPFVFGDSAVTITGQISGPSRPPLPTWVTFTGSLGSGVFSIISTLHSVSSVPFADLAHYDLFANGFGPDFLAGNNITIRFQVPDTLTPNFSGYPGGWAAGTYRFGLTNSRTISGTPASPLQLVLDVQGVPEPFTAALFGIGLAAIGFLNWRRSR